MAIVVSPVRWLVPALVSLVVGAHVPAMAQSADPADDMRCWQSTAPAVPEGEAPEARAFAWAAVDFDAERTQAEKVRDWFRSSLTDYRRRMGCNPSAAVRARGQGGAAILADLVRQSEGLLERGRQASRGCDGAFETYARNFSAEKGTPARALSDKALGQLASCTTKLRKWILDAHEAFKTMDEGATKWIELLDELVEIQGADAPAHP